MARAVGINHVTLEVGSIDEALACWGNQIQVVAYADVQFTKTPAMLRGMGLELEKSTSALGELRDKGLA
jgi:hypothetical protein